jgi:hypothetical protein
MGSTKVVIEENKTGAPTEEETAEIVEFLYMLKVSM